jgi:hypothetical protein
MRGTIGILTGRGPACDALGEWIEREVPLGTVQVRRIPGNQIAWQRNLIVGQYLRPNDEWVLFVDADCIPPRGALARLLSHEVGIVAGLIIERTAPFAVCAVRHLEPFTRYQIEDFPYGDNDLRPVVSVGTGCTLIRRVVFDAVPRPWFRVGQIPGGEDLLAEDLDFCLRAAEVGFPAFLDPAVRVGHETKVTLFPGDAEITVQYEGPTGGLPFRVPLNPEVVRDVHL